MDFHWFLLIFIDCYCFFIDFSSIFIDFSMIFIDFHRFSLIFHWFSSIFHWFLYLGKLLGTPYHRANAVKEVTKIIDKTMWVIVRHPWSIPRVSPIPSVANILAVHILGVHLQRHIGRNGPPQSFRERNLDYGSLATGLVRLQQLQHSLSLHVQPTNSAEVLARKMLAWVKTATDIPIHIFY